MDSPILETQKIKLRPVTSNDYDMLYSWHFSTGQIHLWWDERHIRSFDEFVNDFNNKLRYFFFTFFVVVKREHETDIPVGFTYTSRFNPVDRYVYSTMYLDREFTGKGLGIEAGQIHIQYLFSVFNIRKIYAEIYEYNKISIKAAKKAGFIEEARLKQHRWYIDRYWDLIIMSLHRI